MGLRTAREIVDRAELRAIWSAIKRNGGTLSEGEVEKDPRFGLKPAHGMTALRCAKKYEALAHPKVKARKAPKAKVPKAEAVRAPTPIPVVQGDWASELKSRVAEIEASTAQALGVCLEKARGMKDHHVLTTLVVLKSRVVRPRFETQSMAELWRGIPMNDEEAFRDDVPMGLWRKIVEAEALRRELPTEVYVRGRAT